MTDQNMNWNTALADSLTEDFELLIDCVGTNDVRLEAAGRILGSIGEHQPDLAQMLAQNLGLVEPTFQVTIENCGRDQLIQALIDSGLAGQRTRNLDTADLRFFLIARGVTI